MARSPFWHRLPPRRAHEAVAGCHPTTTRLCSGLSKKRLMAPQGQQDRKSCTYKPPNHCTHTRDSRRIPPCIISQMLREMFFWVMAAVVVQAVGTLALAQSCGICPQGNESGAVGDFPQSLLAAQTYPIGNPPLTYAALSVVGATGQDDEREFLLSLGLVSNRGNQVTFSCAYN
jgi:hypothetical protein